MSRELRERLERAQDARRALTDELERLSTGPQPPSPELQQTLTTLRSEAHRLEQASAELERQLAEAATRRARAERAELEQPVDPSEELRQNSPYIAVVVFAALVGVAWWDGELRLPRWLLLGVNLLVAGWLVRDGWRFGRATARSKRA